MFLQLVISGLTVGGVYALLGVCIAMIFKATDVVNFAQGEFAMVGAYLCYCFYVGFGMSYFAAVCATLLGAAVIGFLMERLVFRPLIRFSVFVAIVSTIAVGIIFKNAARIIWGGDPLTLPSIFSMTPIRMGKIILVPQNLGVIFIAVGAIIALSLFFKYTRFGTAMRATQQNRQVATLMGISVKRVFSVTWVASFVLGAGAGVLFAPLVGMTPEMGSIGLKGFAAAVVGGFTSMPGSILGGFTLGIAENVAAAYLGAWSKDITAFFILILILTVKPTGLLERAVKKKV